MAKNSEKTEARAGEEKPRQVKTPKYRSFRLQKKVKAAVSAPLPSAFRLFRTALGTIKRQPEVFFGIVGIYALVSLVFVQGLSTLSAVGQTTAALETGLVDNVAQFFSLFNSATAGSPSAGIYQLLIFLVASLVLIWVLRQVWAGHTVRVRDGFYRGMYPLVPFVLVLGMIGLQLLPLVVGGAIYSMVMRNGIAVTGTETLLWATGFFVLALVSLYLICSSLFALYIVCLPDVAPLQALRSARALVLGRRLLVLRKILFLPLILIVLAGVVMLPLIMFAAPLAGWAFFAFSMLALAVAHSYLYGLYRSLL